MNNILFKLRIWFFTGILFISGYGIADHPKEGSLTLEELLREGEDQNLDIKAVENQYAASNFEVNSKKALMWPQLSIEGGVLSSKEEDKSHFKNFLYGKAEWNIYNGGQDFKEIEKFKIKSDLVKKQIEWVKSKVKREIAHIYYEILFLLESSALKKKAIEMNQEHMKLGVRKKASGFTSLADVIEFELHDTLLKSDLIMLNQEFLEKSRDLAILLGRKNSALPIQVKGHIAREALRSLHHDSVLAQMQDSNMEIVSAEAEIKISRIESKIIKSGFLPSVDLEAVYGKLANEERVFTGQEEHSMTLKISLPIFTGYETLNQIKSINFSILSQEVLVSKKKFAAKFEAEKLFEKLSTLNDRLDLEEKKLLKLEEYYKITLGEYRRGIKNSPDMVGASERLFDARLRNLEYRKEYYITKLKIYDLLSSYPKD